MSAELLSSVLAVVLSLLVGYVPGFSGWFGALPGVQKRLLMAGLLVVIGAASVGLACAGVALPFSLSCDYAGGWAVLRAVLAALVANQATYSLLVRSAGGGADA